MKHMHTQYALTGILCLLLLALGCTQTIVPLQYQPAVISSLPGCPQQDLVVLPFTDSREDTLRIGLTAKGTPFYPEQFVEDWFTTALIKQLRSAGCSVNKGSEKSPPGEFLVKGEILTAFLRQHSSSEYTVNLEMTLMLRQQGKKIYEENFSVEMKQWFLPKKNTPAMFLEQAMQELMRTAVPKLLRAAEGA